MEEKKDPTIKIEKWFKNVCGDYEADWRKRSDKSSLIKRESNDPVPTLGGHPYLLIENPVTKQVFKAGRFSVERLDDLMTQVNSSSKSSNNTLSTQKPCLFEILVRAEDRRSVDVAYLQSLPEMRGAVFQAASNFNGIEAISEFSSPDQENFTEKYYMDGTQGPAASIRFLFLFFFFLFLKEKK